MLDRASRLTRSGDFTTAVRRGRRCGGPLLVVHLWVPPVAPEAATPGPARAGLVVSRAVGDAVTRNRVKRRMRHLLRDLLGARLTGLPDGALLVVRALPAAATVDSPRLRADLERGLRSCLRASEERR